MNLIAAAAEDWGIGCSGKLLYHLRRDLARFKELTMGHDIIMGRRTLESLPEGKPLAGRRNLVLSRDYRAEGIITARTVEEAVDLAEPDAFVIGGGSVYRQMLDFCDRAYITKIYARRECDTYCPNLDDNPDWKLVKRGERMCESGIEFAFFEYRRG